MSNIIQFRTKQEEKIRTNDIQEMYFEELMNKTEDACNETYKVMTSEEGEM